MLGNRLRWNHEFSSCDARSHLSYSLKMSKVRTRGYIGDYARDSYRGFFSGDSRSLDYSSYHDRTGSTLAPKRIVNENMAVQGNAKVVTS